MVSFESQSYVWSYLDWSLCMAKDMVCSHWKRQSSDIIKSEMYSKQGDRKGVRASDVQFSLLLSDIYITFLLLADSRPRIRWWACEMPHWVKVIASKPDDLSLIPRTYMV